MVISFFFILIKNFLNKKEIKKFCWIILVGDTMNNIKEFDEIKIKDMIYEIRGKQVMLDSEISATKWHDKEY